MKKEEVTGTMAPVENAARPFEMAHIACSLTP